MSYTVKGLAKLSGVSVSMLHFYDEIGLLKPFSRGQNGYRYYGESELLTLQQILFYRELDIPLNEIGVLLKSHDFDNLQSLKKHKTVLLQTINHKQRLVQTIDQTINNLEGIVKMKHKELYAGFEDRLKSYEEEMIESGTLKALDFEKLIDLARNFEEKLPKNAMRDFVNKITEEGGFEEGEQHLYMKYMVKSGQITMEEVDQQLKRAQSLTPEILLEIAEKGQLLHQKTLEMADKNTDPSSDEAQALVDEGYYFANAQTPMTKERFVEHSKFSLQFFHDLYNEIYPKLGEFLERSMDVWAKRHRDKN